jgi:hypothetical protein
MKKILTLFHHIHHQDKGHEVHHCGGKHKGLNYTIKHCSCKKHSIDKQEATGHDFENKEVKVKFSEKCKEGGWHIESGVIE